MDSIWHTLRKHHWVSGRFSIWSLYTFLSRSCGPLNLTYSWTAVWLCWENIPFTYCNHITSVQATHGTSIAKNLVKLEYTYENSERNVQRWCHWDETIMLAFHFKTFVMLQDIWRAGIWIQINWSNYIVCTSIHRFGIWKWRFVVTKAALK